MGIGHNDQDCQHHIAMAAIAEQGFGLETCHVERSSHHQW